MDYLSPIRIDRIMHKYETSSQAPQKAKRITPIEVFEAVKGLVEECIPSQSQDIYSHFQKKEGDDAEK